MGSTHNTNWLMHASKIFSKGWRCSIKFIRNGRHFSRGHVSRRLKEPMILSSQTTLTKWNKTLADKTDGGNGFREKCLGMWKIPVKGKWHRSTQREESLEAVRKYKSSFQFPTALCLCEMVTAPIWKNEPKMVWGLGCSEIKQLQDSWSVIVTWRWICHKWIL